MEAQHIATYHASFSVPEVRMMMVMMMKSENDEGDDHEGEDDEGDGDGGDCDFFWGGKGGVRQETLTHLEHGGSMASLTSI